MRRPRRRSRWIRPALAAALLSPALALGALSGASAAPVASPPPDAVTIYQVLGDGLSALDLAAALFADGYDLVEARDGDTLFVVGTDATGTELAARTDLTVVGAEPVSPIDESETPGANQDDILPRKLDGNQYETFYGGYRTANAFVEFENDVAAAYPNLVKLVKYGDSFTGDNPLRALCVTVNADQNCALEPTTEKGRLLFMAQIHARELSTSELSWRLLTRLIDGQGRSADITALLNDTEIWIVPEANPDGIETVEKGIEEDGFGSTSNAWQRKNLNPGDVNCGTGQSSQIGVDLNRNWDAFWGGAGSSPQQCSLVYHGESAASEPETSDLAELFRDLFEDQRGPGSGDEAPANTRGALLTLHSYSNLVLFPYGSGGNTPNDEGLRSMAFRMSYFNGYTTGRPNEILYEVTGSTDDFSYKDLGIASFTYEIGPQSGTCGGFHPPYSCQDTFWDLNREAILYAANAAQQPYTQGMGPTITQARSRLDAGRVKITGTADDGAYGTSGVGRPASQNVVDARLFVGKAPWDGGTAKPVNIIGSGDRVEFKSSLKANAKEKKVYLQAKDGAGNWGPVEVVWRLAR